MKIYGDTLSPFVRMCIVTAHEVGLGEKLIQDKERVNAAAANGKLTGLSPIGKVPVLETDHGHPLHDSRVIIEYLCHIAGNSTFIPDDGVKRFRVLTLLAIAQGLADAAVALRTELAVRPQGLQWPELATRLKTRINAACDDLETHWEAEKAEVNAGSIATAVALSYVDFRLADLGWRDGRPNLAAFHQRFAARDSMKLTEISS